MTPTDILQYFKGYNGILQEIHAMHTVRLILAADILELPVIFLISPKTVVTQLHKLLPFKPICWVSHFNFKYTLKGRSGKTCNWQGM